MSGFHFLTEYLLENMYLSCKSKEFETRLLARVKISLAEPHHNLLKPKYCKFFYIRIKNSHKRAT